jgi:hypothetical protein
MSSAVSETKVYEQLFFLTFIYSLNTWKLDPRTNFLASLNIYGKNISQGG